MRMPPRALGSRYGAFVMLSMPPATITSTEPAASMSCANMRRAHAGAAHLVDRGAAGRKRQARAERGLPRGRLRRVPRAARSPITTSSICSGVRPAR